jgi:lambda family phage portal protein
MGFFDLFRSPAPVVERSMAPNPHRNPRVRSGFFSTEVNRLLHGWDTSSNSIDYYLRGELTGLRARSRKMVRANPYGKRFIAMIKSNVVGPNGVTIQAQTTRFRQNEGLVLDTRANEAIEAAFLDWALYHCDYTGKSTWIDLQNMAISCAAQDGEFLFRKMYAGKYGYQLKCIDPELLDIQKNEKTKNGEIRLGVEYNAAGRAINYWFRELNSGLYNSGKSIAVPAGQIIHGFISEWPDQSRGAPWMHASLERGKHLEKYEEAAIVKARSTAATFGVMTSNGGEDSYAGDEDAGDGVTLDQYEAGTIKDIGDRTFQNVDSSYPHQMYAAFVKSQLQGIASGLGISYHSLANDLEGVNYSSIRAGVLEDREVFKGLQNWFIRSLVRPVYDDWLVFALTKQAIKIGTVPLSRDVNDYRGAHYQGRRWAWVDPQKDGAANKLAIDERLKSRSQIMRDAGDDPESTWLEIQREEQLLEKLGIQPIVKEQQPVEDKADE